MSKRRKEKLYKISVADIKSHIQIVKDECEKLDDLIVNYEGDNSFDFVRGFYNYLFYSTLIETLIRQLFLYTFKNDYELKIFEFEKKNSDFVDSTAVIPLLDETWLNSIDINLLLSFSNINNKKIRDLLVNFNKEKFISFYSECRDIRNNIAHNFDDSELAFREEMLNKFKIISSILIYKLKSLE